MANITMVDDLPKLSENFTDDLITVYDDTPYDKIFLELFTLVGILSATSNIILSFIIVKYKKMREEPTNVIFLQINILGAVYLFATPLTLRLIMVFTDNVAISGAMFCYVYQIEVSLTFGITLLLFLLLFDWYIKLYHKETYTKFSRVYKFFIITVYVLTTLCISITLQLCHKLVMAMTMYLVMVICLALLFLSDIILNIIHAFKKRRIVIDHRKGNIGLAVANIFLLSWTPAVIFILVSFVGMYLNYAVALIIVFIFGFCSPIFTVIYLYFYEDNYHIFLRQVLTCKCNEYKNDPLDNTSVVYNDVEGVHISEN